LPTPPATSATWLSSQHLLGPLMLTMQTAQHHAIAGASETAGSLVFRPRERSPTHLHQAPSPLQRCAPSRLSTISGPAEPKSLSRPASSSLDRPNTHYLNLSIRRRPLRSLHHLHVIARSHVFAQTLPRPKLRLSHYSCFALVLYQPKFPERIHGLAAVV